MTCCIDIGIYLSSCQQVLEFIALGRLSPVQHKKSGTDAVSSLT